MDESMHLWKATQRLIKCDECESTGNTECWIAMETKGYTIKQFGSFCFYGSLLLDGFRQV